MSGRWPLAATALALALVGATVAAAGTLIRNGALTKGSADTPEDWHTTTWAPEKVTFAWEVAPDGSGALRMTNTEPNDARWCQKVPVEPGGTYRVTTRVKTSDVGTTTAGAHIAIEPRVTDSLDVQGTRDWQRLEVVARAGEESSWEVCGRLGSYANLNTGTAWFTDFAMEQISRAPPRPSRVALLWRETRWSAIVVPLVGGILLAYGLGLGRRHAVDAGRDEAASVSAPDAGTPVAAADDAPAAEPSAPEPAPEPEPEGGPDGNDPPF